MKNWLTENIFDSLNRQEGEESGYEGVLQERHVMERVGGVQQTENCRDQIREEIHLWKCDHFTSNFIQSNKSFLCGERRDVVRWCVLHDGDHCAVCSVMV